jgi:hypothetical protein
MRARRTSATVWVMCAGSRWSAIRAASNCTPTIGQCQQHHAAIGGKSATIEGSSDFLARNGWQVEVESIIVGHGGCGSEARCAQDGFDTHSLRKLNALRHTCQLKFQTG